MAQNRTVYGMTEKEREEEISGIKMVPYYDRRRGYDSKQEEVSLPLTVEEIDLIGRAIQRYAPKILIAQDLAALLGIKMGDPEVKVAKVLHFRLAHAAHLLDAERFPDPIDRLADKLQEEQVPEAVNETEEEIEPRS